MYRVLIIDDEKFIRKSIRNRINWEKYGFSVAAEAGNGAEAIRIMSEITPHLIIVDIRMPVMDGLAFIKEARKKFPKSIYVIMSAYSDFEYARRAMQLGVAEYVLKPIEEEEMERILEEAAYRLNKENVIKQMNQREFCESVFPVNGTRIGAMAFWNKDEEYGERMEEAIRRNPYIIENHIKLYFLEEHCREHCFLYLAAGEGLTEDGIRKALENLLQDEEKHVKAAYSGIYDGSKVKEATSESIQTLKRKIFYPDRTILYAEPCDGKKEERYRALKEKILSAQKGFLKQEYRKSIQEFMNIVDQTILKENSIHNIEEVIREIILLLWYFAEDQSSRTDFNIMFHRFQSRDYLLVYDTADELKVNLKKMLSSFMELYSDRRSKETVDIIKDYIKENFFEDLNASNIAGRFYLNPSYLSTMFREKTGMKLMSYIEGIRMEKAKEYLKNNVWTVTEIAIETGYSDSNYFSKVFKKYTGVSPKQYRERALRDRSFV